MNDSPDHSSKRRRIVAGSLMAVALAAGGATVASAQSNPSPPAPSTAPAAPNAGDQGDPTYTSSITVPKSANDGAGADSAAQDAALTKLAKVSPAQAKAAATAAVNGNAGTPELSDENGNVIYDIAVTSVDGKTGTDVKVDAGNGNILAKEAANDTGGDKETGKDSGPNDAGDQGQPDGEQPGT